MPELLTILKKQHLITVLQVRVDGMKAENARRIFLEDCPAYDEPDFDRIADEMENIINAPGEQM